MIEDDGSPTVDDDCFLGSANTLALCMADEPFGYVQLIQCCAYPGTGKATSSYDSSSYCFAYASNFGASFERGRALASNHLIMLYNPTTGKVRVLGHVTELTVVAAKAAVLWAAENGHKLKCDLKVSQGKPFLDQAGWMDGWPSVVG